MEHLKESRAYFEKFRRTHIERYFKSIKGFKPVPKNGYGSFYRQKFVFSEITAVCSFLRDEYEDISIPKGFLTPKMLIQSWIQFSDMLKIVDEQFNQIKSYIYDESKKLPSFDASENHYYYYPEPLIQYDNINREVMEALSFVLEMDEVKAVTNSLEIIIEIGNTVELICRNFHRYCLQMRHRYAARPYIEIQDEYDVQDLLHSIFTLHFDDVRAEEATPSCAGSSSRMDFLIAKDKIAVEVKKTRQKLKNKQIMNELLIDIGRYASHTTVKKLICFVYDPDHFITNPSGVERDLSVSRGCIDVCVIITPKGK